MQSVATMAKHYSIKQENKKKDSIGGVHKQIMIKIATQSFEDLKIIVHGHAKTKGNWGLKHKHMHTKGVDFELLIIRPTCDC